MEHRRLGKSGLQVSTFCLGTMTFGDSETFMKGVTSPDDEAGRVLDRALEAGIDFVDTANVYSEGRSEELLGKLLGKRRKNVVLATKCRFATGRSARPMEMGLSRRHILEACDASLQRLGTDWIDLYQVHMQDARTPIEETLRALDDLVRSGKVRYIGCSNYAGYRLVESLWTSDKRNLVRYDTFQFQWSLIERGAEREIVPACREFGLGTMIWSPLCRGFLSGRYEKGKAPPAGSRLESWKDTWTKYANSERTWRILDAVRGMAKELGTTPAAVSLAWLLAKPECSTIIVGARDVKQLDDNLGGLEVKLNAAQVAALDRVSEPTWEYPYDFIGARERW
jgi:aryl-alcohol dehydrogenase-like predicted oxidoreductase